MNATSSHFVGSVATLSADIWTSFLHDALSARQLAVRHLLVLGSPQVGKSAVVEQMLRGKRGGHVELADTNNLNLDLGLSYIYTDINDDDNEEVLMRIGMYQLSSPHPTQRALLSVDRPFIANAMAIIVLDWSKPWAFLQDLQIWLTTLESIVKSSITEKTAIEQNVNDQTSVESSIEWWKNIREAVRCQFQNYAEPSEQNNENETTRLALQHPDAQLPLGPGCLTRNIGLPIAIVCAKSDYMTTLEKERDFREDRFDFIQQTLRTIALQYGASLFYTTVQKPTTFSTLRSYVLHRLGALSGDASITIADGIIDTVDRQLSYNAPLIPTISSNIFSFPYLAQIIERDIVVLPSGWDSRGKIGLLHKGFSCEDFDFSFTESTNAQSPSNNHSSNDAEILLNQLGQMSFADKCDVLYQTAIGSTVSPRDTISLPPAVSAEDEQHFLERHAEMLGSKSGNTITANDGSNGINATDSATARLARLARIKQQQQQQQQQGFGNSVNASPIQPRMSIQTSNTDALRVGALGITPSTTTPDSAVASDQNQVLANFFQSLLKKSNSATASPTGFASGSLDLTDTVASPNSNLGPVSANSAVRKDSSKELDRIRQGLLSGNSSISSIQPSSKSPPP